MVLFAWVAHQNYFQHFNDLMNFLVIHGKKLQQQLFSVFYCSTKSMFYIFIYVCLNNVKSTSTVCSF